MQWVVFFALLGLLILAAFGIGIAMSYPLFGWPFLAMIAVGLWALASFDKNRIRQEKASAEALGRSLTQRVFDSALDDGFDLKVYGKNRLIVPILLYVAAGAICWAVLEAIQPNLHSLEGELVWLAIWMIILFFFLCAVVTFWKWALHRRQPHLIVSIQGIRTPLYGLIEWHQIKDLNFDNTLNDDGTMLFTTLKLAVPSLYSRRFRMSTLQHLLLDFRLPWRRQTARIRLDIPHHEVSAVYTASHRLKNAAKSSTAI